MHAASRFRSPSPTPSLQVSSAPSAVATLPIERLPDPPFAVHKLIAKPAAVAEKVAVDLAVVAVHHPPQHSVALAAVMLHPKRAMHAHRGRHLQIPLARVVPLQRGIGEYAGGADLHQVPGEFVLQHAVFGRGRKRRCSAKQMRSDRLRRRTRDRNARSGSTGCSGSSHGSRRGPGTDCETCAFRMCSGDSRGPS